MALNLDARQRAMLKAMGITIWLPEPAAVQPAGVDTPADEPAPHSAALRAAPASVPAARPELPPATAAPATTAPATTATATTTAAAPAPQPAPAAEAGATNAAGAARTQHTPPARGTLSTHAHRQPARDFVQQPAAGPAGEPGLGWTIGPAQLVYPHAPQHAQGDEGTAQGGWLILLEPPANPALLSPAQKPSPDSAQTALQGDAARLLDQMLRALGLQHQPRVYSAALHRPPHDADLSHAQPLQPALQAVLRELQPQCVLVLGLASARAVLGRHDALGPLRTEPHRIAGIPTVITYDPNYLLRAPQAKAAAWADLVQAAAHTKQS